MDPQSGLMMLTYKNGDLVADDNDKANLLTNFFHKTLIANA